MNPVLQQAGELHRKRLLPAKLKVEGVEGKKNALYFNNWAVSKGLNLAAMTAQAISDEFYLAVVADVQAEFPQLLWEVVPKTLAKRVADQGNPNGRQSAKDIDDLNKRKVESEKADARIKEQEAAKKRVVGLIAAFTPTRRGVLRYALRDKKQSEWREQVAKATDFTKLEVAIKKEQEEIYAQLERPEQV